MNIEVGGDGAVIAPNAAKHRNQLFYLWTNNVHITGIQHRLMASAADDIHAIGAAFVIHQLHAVAPIGGQRNKVFLAAERVMLAVNFGSHSGVVAEIGMDQHPRCMASFGRNNIFSGPGDAAQGTEIEVGTVIRSMGGG